MNPATTLKRYLSIAAITVGATLAGPATAAPVLVGSAMLNTANDLTVIQNGALKLEFIDLTVTQGSSVADALALYGASGFTWATGAEVAQLYAAFGFTYASTPSLPTPINVSPAIAAIYSSYLGATFMDVSAGWIDDNNTAFLHTYDCISQVSCSPGPTIGNGTFGWPSHPYIGVYLVRESLNAVPEPGTIALLLLAGLIGFVGMPRSNSAKSAKTV